MKMFSRFLIIFFLGIALLHSDESFYTKSYEAYDRGKYHDSIYFLEAELNKQNKQIPLDLIMISTIYNDIGLAYMKLKKYSKALEYMNKSLSLRKTNLEKNHEFIGMSYNNLGRIYKEKKEYSTALNYYIKSMNIFTALENKNHLAVVYGNIGETYKVMKDYFNAKESYQKMIILDEKLFGKNNLGLANSYSNIGRSYQEMGDYRGSIDFFKKSLSITKESQGNNSIVTARSYYNLGVTYLNMNSYSNAITFLTKAVKIQEQILGIKDLETAKTYGALGEYYNKIGNYLKALKYFQKSLKIKESKSIKKFSIYNNIGSLHENIGQYEKALKYYNKGLFIQNISSLEKSISYNNLSGVYSKQGNFLKALDYLKKSLSIAEEILGAKHVTTALIYNNLGELYTRLGQKNKAFFFLKKALFVFEKSFTKKNMLLAGSYNNLGLLYQSTGQYAKSLKYFKRSVIIHENFLGKEHYKTALNYNNLGGLYEKMKDYNSAYKYLKKSFDIFMTNKDIIFINLNATEKNKYLQSHYNEIGYLLYIISFYENELSNSNKLIIGMVNDLLNYKGSIFNSENIFVSLYFNTNNLIIKKKIKTLFNMKKDLAQLYQTIPNEKEIWSRNIKSNEKKIMNLKEELNKYPSFEKLQELKNITYVDIMPNLDNNEIYIDFLQVNGNYYYFYLTKTQLQFVSLGTYESQNIDKLITNFRKDIQKIIDIKKNITEKRVLLKISLRQKLEKLYKLIFDIPLKEKLKNKTSLIISPDGALRLLPFEALYDKERQEYLIQSKEIRYIPSGKEFVRLHKYAKKRVSTNNTITVFANPNFDSNQSASFHKEQIALTRGTNENIIKPFFKESYSPLLGTEVEAKAIDKIMDNVEIFEGNRANETNLLAVKEPKILHIATHGFFINTPNIPNPMLKSGIVLSGVNYYAKRKQGYGRVTALKLSGLNLRSTDLVVLSACETGVVDVNDTDSISGLGKAFIQAGAKDVVMSLWSVDDNATKELMIDFYRGIKEHSNYSKALREAKLKMIDEGRHPFYWGGFVLNGL